MCGIQSIIGGVKNPFLKDKKKEKHYTIEDVFVIKCLKDVKFEL